MCSDKTCIFAVPPYCNALLPSESSGLLSLSWFRNLKWPFIAIYLANLTLWLTIYTLPKNGFIFSSFWCQRTWRQCSGSLTRRLNFAQISESLQDANTWRIRDRNSSHSDLASRQICLITGLRSFVTRIQRINMQKNRSNHGFIQVLLIWQRIFTSLRKELRINALESVLPNYSRRAFGFEASVDSLQLCLSKPRGSAQRGQTVWAISRWRLEVLKIRVWKARNNY